MKFLINNTIIKKILIVLITIIMVSNFIMPNYVHAASPGEKLVSGFFYLLAYLGDAGLSIMQRMMMGTGDLKELDEYAIKYSPGIIFAGKVPALDINFIGANEGSNGSIDRFVTDVNSKSDMITLVEKLDKTSFTEVFSGTTFEADEMQKYGATCDENFRLMDPNEYLLTITNFRKLAVP